MTVRHRVSQTGEVEEALRRSEAKYRAIFEKMQDIFFQTDRQGFIVEVSPSVKRYGYAREELIGTPAAGVYEDPGKRITLTQLLENGEVTDREVRLKARDGRVVDCSLSFHMLRDADGAPAGTEGCLRDISDRKRVEEELRSRTHDLGERVKELECLYGISKLARRPDISLEELLRGTVDLIPPGWQYPEVTCARITLGGSRVSGRRTSEKRPGGRRATSSRMASGPALWRSATCRRSPRPMRAPS